VSFAYHQDELYAENLPIAKIADAVGTPFYCYSASAIRDRFSGYAKHFNQAGSLVCYAVKANSNQSVIGLLAGMGAGADVVSGGELQRALAAGIPASRIVYSGVAKTAEEMALALSMDILQFNVESEPELERLNGVALEMGKRAPVAFRINPDIDAHTHHKTTTGKSENKFGVPLSRAAEVYDWAAALPGIRVQGIDMHIGSQLTQIEPFEQAFRCLAELTEALRQRGHDISVLDIGGGLGIRYDDSGTPPPLADYATLAKDILGPTGCRLVVEPGRSIVGEAGILVAKGIYLKQGEQRRFLIIDAGMNDLIRPSLYDAHHEIVPVHRREGLVSDYDVVGPICETGDTFACQEPLPPMLAGDLVAIRNAGAYGAVMASFYNTRPFVPEVLVEGDQFRVVRPRVDALAQIAMDCSG